MQSGIQAIVKDTKANLKSIRLLRFAKWQFYYKRKLPSAIEIELDGLCNRKCGYCPVSIEPRPKQKMSFELYQKIILELKRIEWSGMLSPHFYNEPLLDKRLKEFLIFTRKSLQDNVYTKVVTNGDLLKTELFREWVEDLKIVDWFSVSIHDDSPKKHLLDLMEYVKSSSLEKHLTFINMKSDKTAKCNRAGLVEVDDDIFRQKLRKFGCNWALKMVITASGNYLYCCNDYYEQDIIGNVFERSLRDMWFETVEERKKLYLADYEREMCKVCVGIY